MKTARKMTNIIRHAEKSCGYWQVSTLTEDGHRISGFGYSQKQAIYDAHNKAKAYGEYDYPCFGANQ